MADRWCTVNDLRLTIMGFDNEIKNNEITTDDLNYIIEEATEDAKACITGIFDFSLYADPYPPLLVKFTKLKSALLLDQKYSFSDGIGTTLKDQVKSVERKLHKGILYTSTGVAIVATSGPETLLAGDSLTTTVEDLYSGRLRAGQKDITLEEDWADE